MGSSSLPSVVVVVVVDAAVAVAVAELLFGVA